jgi:hypothetical protein
MFQRAMFAATAVLSACTTVQAQDRRYPFEGRWQCEVGVFVFTGTHYTPAGARSIRYKNVEKFLDDYSISFVDGYRISLFGVSPKTMTWHSPASGDTFACTKFNTGL